MIRYVDENENENENETRMDEHQEGVDDVVIACTGGVIDSGEVSFDSM